MKKKARKWQTLEYAGPAFPPDLPRIPERSRPKYENRALDFKGDALDALVSLSRLQIADKPSKHLKNRTFMNNFWKDFTALLAKDHPAYHRKIQRPQELDLRPLQTYLRDHKDAFTRSKEDTADLKEIHSSCELDGEKCDVTGWMVEPPGIFMGRPGSPKVGRIKTRIQPNQVTLNVSRLTDLTLEWDWKELVKNQSVGWIASYTNNLGETKFIYPGSDSKLKVKSDRSKFDTARNLGGKMRTIQKSYLKAMQSGNEKTVQKGLAVYMIDKLALRVGHEKGKDAADTVGCTTLRKEHITLLRKPKIRLRFKGKDSIEYDNTVKVLPSVWNILKRNLSRKADKKALIFDKIRATDVNDYLKSFKLAKLSAKVFRTYHTSTAFQKGLRRRKRKQGKDSDLLKIYKSSNLQAAKICNHKRTVNKLTAKKTLKRLQEGIAKKTSQIKDLNRKNRKLAKPSQKPKFQNRIQRLKTQVDEKKWDLAFKKTAQDFALTTSVLNYIDPRITVAWCKQNELKTSRVWNKGQQKKFKWAETTPKTFKF